MNDEWKWFLKDYSYFPLLIKEPATLSLIFHQKSIYQVPQPAGNMLVHRIPKQPHGLAVAFQSLSYKPTGGVVSQHQHHQINMHSIQSSHIP